MPATIHRAAALLSGGAAILAVVATGAPAAKGPKNGTVSIAATPALVTFGQATTFSGKAQGAKAGVAVVLQRDPYPFGDGWAGLLSTATDQGGNYSFTVAATKNTQFRAVTGETPGRTSSTMLVQVRPAVGLRTSTTTPKAGTRVRFFGSVRPRHGGRRVSVQRRTATGAWTTLARPLLTNVTATRSTYGVRLRVRKDGLYRAVLPAHGDHLRGTSTTRALDAR